MTIEMLGANTLVDVEGGGCGQYGVSAAGPDWPTILYWAPAGHGRVETDDEVDVSTTLASLRVRAQGTAQVPEFRQLSVATFGSLRVKYEPTMAFAKEWGQRLPGACLAILLADVHRPRQLDLWLPTCTRFGCRDVDPVTGKFIAPPKRGRRPEGAWPAPCNALDGSNYFRNLYSIMLGEDVSAEAFATWTSGEVPPPALTLQSLSPWLELTSAAVVVWEHSGSGATRLGPGEEGTNLGPRTLHAGVLEGHVYQLILSGPWENKFAAEDSGSTAFALEHGIPTRRWFRFLREAGDPPHEQGNGDGGAPATQVFDSCIEVADAFREEQRASSAAQGMQRAPSGKAERWFVPPGSDLRGLMIFLHREGITCEGRLCSYGHWSSLDAPGLGILIQTWCEASMGGLDPDQVTPAEAARLTDLHARRLATLCQEAMDFRVISQYSPSLATLPECFWRGPVVGAEAVGGTTYTSTDWQCDIHLAHPAAMLDIKEVPAFGHLDEVQVYDGHTIELRTLYVVQLSPQWPDAFLNADVTPTFGRSYLKYLSLSKEGTGTAEHRITHFVRPSRVVHNCHIPSVVTEVLGEDLFDPRLRDPEVDRKFKKDLLVTLSGRMQQRFSDSIRATMVTGAEEATAVGGRIMPVRGEVEELMVTVHEGGILEQALPSHTDAHICLRWLRDWYKDGFYPLGLFILDSTRRRVLKIRNALAACGACDFSVQCDAVFYRGRVEVQHNMRARWPSLFSKGGGKPSTVKIEPAVGGSAGKARHARPFRAMEIKRSLEALLPTMRDPIPCPPAPAGVTVPLWKGRGRVFATPDAAHEAWSTLARKSKANQWNRICADENAAVLRGELEDLIAAEGRLCCTVTGEHRGVGKSYCAYRAATAMFDTGLILMPTNSLRTSFADVPEGWTVKTMDTQLGFYVGQDMGVRKASGTLRVPGVDVIILEEAAYVPAQALSMLLAAAHHRAVHIIATYDLHQLEPVEATTGMSIGKDNRDRAALLRQAFPTCFHIFARKRDTTREEQVEMDDILLGILAAPGDEDPQTMVLQTLGRGREREDGEPVFHLAYTRECARYHALQELPKHAPDTVLAPGAVVVGFKYHSLGKAGLVQKNHEYSAVAAAKGLVTVWSEFDSGESLAGVTMSLVLAEHLFDPPCASTVLAVQGRTVEGLLVVHEALHPYVTKRWPCTAVSWGRAATNVRVLANVHDADTADGAMDESQRAAWAVAKARAYLAVDLKAGRPADMGAGEALAQVLLGSWGEACSHCHNAMVWARHSECQPMLNRMDNTIGHKPWNVDVACLHCNHAGAGSAEATATRGSRHLHVRLEQLRGLPHLPLAGGQADASGA